MHTDSYITLWNSSGKDAVRAYSPPVYGGGGGGGGGVAARSVSPAEKLVLKLNSFEAAPPTCYSEYINNISSCALPVVQVEIFPAKSIVNMYSYCL